MTHWRVTVECAPSEKDFVIADLAEAGASGLLEEDGLPDRCRLVAFFSHASAAEAVAARWSAVLAAEPERDWLSVARQQWRPLPVGRRFYLVPEWSQEPAPPGRLRLRMRSGLAAGSGWHPATRLALEALEEFLRPGDAVLDLGTGSGILATAAALLGAGVVFACDMDAEAVHVARQNLCHDGVPASMFVGSLRSVRTQSLDLIVANLHAPALHALSKEIVRTLKPAGRVVLSGFSHDQAPGLCARLDSKGLSLLDRRRHGDWASLVLGLPQSHG